MKCIIPYMHPTTHMKIFVYFRATTLLLFFNAKCIAYFATTSRERNNTGVCIRNTALSTTLVPHDCKLTYREVSIYIIRAQSGLIFPACIA